MWGQIGAPGLTRAGLQLSAAVAAHVAAAGCLPDARSLIAAVPAALVALLLLDRLVGERPLLGLACGQLTAHAVLTAASACTTHAATHAAGSSASHLSMAAGHVVALVLCRAALGRAVLLVERGAERVRGLAHRVLLVLMPAATPVLPRLAVAAPAALLGRDVTLRARVRGPPSAILRPVT